MELIQNGARSVGRKQTKQLKTNRAGSSGGQRADGGTDPVTKASVTRRHSPDTTLLTLLTLLWARHRSPSINSWHFWTWQRLNKWKRLFSSRFLHCVVVLFVRRAPITLWMFSSGTCRTHNGSVPSRPGNHSHCHHASVAWSKTSLSI